MKWYNNSITKFTSYHVDGISIRNIFKSMQPVAKDNTNSILIYLKLYCSMSELNYYWALIQICIRTKRKAISHFI